MGKSIGGSKKYRQDVVLRACQEWKSTYGDKPFTSTDLEQSGFIRFKFKTQHISQRSISTILGILLRRGHLVKVVDGGQKRQSQYKVD